VSAAFTPGPWAVHPVNAWVCVADSLDENPVCAMCRTADNIDGDATFANARLIAAAPELYEAGFRILECIDHPKARIRQLDIDALRAALRKARGEHD
jgi:hypothetical protein